MAQASDERFRGSVQAKCQNSQAHQVMTGNKVEPEVTLGMPPTR